jgi:hypothetical protein
MDIQERIKELEANNPGYDIGDLLEKHFFQRNGEDPISGEAWAENDKEVIYFVEKEKLDYKTIASRLYDYLKSLPNGTELSTHEALDKLFGKPQVQYKDYNGCTYFYGGIVIKEDDFWDIHDSLMGKIAMGHKYDADFSKYEDQNVGLPYNIPFVFKLKIK